MNNLAPIALFVYNRPEHTRKTVEALFQNELANQSRLYIFCDGVKPGTDTTPIEAVRKYVRSISGFASITIRESDVNQGLSKSIISGVTEVVSKHGKIIVMEDDLVTSKYFLTYMNETLEMYKDEDRVASIHGYIYPIKTKVPETFFIRGADCWGWATWKRGWDLFEPDGAKLLTKLKEKRLIREFDFDDTYPYSKMLERQIAGLTDSWAIRWYASAFLKNKLTLYPGVSLVDNIGQDASGTHGKMSEIYSTVISQKKIVIERLTSNENLLARKAIAAYFRSHKPTMIQKILRKLKLKS